MLQDSMRFSISSELSMRPAESSLMVSAEKDPEAEKAPSISYIKMTRLCLYIVALRLLVPKIVWY